jgi:hypothetical protein
MSEIFLVFLVFFNFFWIILLCAKFGDQSLFLDSYAPAQSWFKGSEPFFRVVVHLQRAESGGQSTFSEQKSRGQSIKSIKKAAKSKILTF